jgi:peptidoglycan hydrolase-like protein with peptidoglycan-binding domain
MCKRAGYLILLMFSSFWAYGQFYSYGVSAGAHVAQLKIDPFSIDPNQPLETISFTATGGFHAGIYARLGAGLVYLEPQLWYTELNQDITYSDGTGASTTVPWTLRRLDVPLEVGVKMGPLLILAAPVWSLPIAQVSNVQTITVDSGTWGGQVGVGVKFGPVQLTARYEGSLAPFADQIQIGGASYATDGRISQLITSLHLKL